ncbi:MAG: hypothetical protein ACXADW_11585 [Candidatus Hodarchaeales archaeon]|jgi:hypothetical protein
MSLRTISDVEKEIQICNNTLIDLKNEKAKIKLCEITKISESQLSKIKDFQVTCSYKESNPSEYALYINCELKVSFTRHSITRNLHIKYASRQPDDDGDRYSSSIDCDIDSNKKTDPIIKKILDIEDEDEDNWKYLISELNG